jgi:hypothetical protein
MSSCNCSDGKDRCTQDFSGEPLREQVLGTLMKEDNVKMDFRLIGCEYER